jgi:hypothetical protein
MAVALGVWGVNISARFQDISQRKTGVLRALCNGRDAALKGTLRSALAP